MSNFCNKVIQQAWLSLLPLILLTVLVSNVQVAVTASFSATGEGTTDNLGINTTFNVADNDVGLTGNYYAALNYNNDWYFKTPQGWVHYQSGPLPVYLTAVLVSTTTRLLSNSDFSKYIGARVFIGYGLTQKEMLANSRYAKVYTITTDSLTRLVQPSGTAC